MKIAVILNGISKKKKNFYHRILPALKELWPVDVYETRAKDDAITHAANVVNKEYDLILAAGGDGTLHQVLNGLLNNNEESPILPVLGVIPIGSGNDFAKAVYIDGTAKQLVRLITDFRPRQIDIGKVHFSIDTSEFNQRHRYFINEADIGMGPEVVKKVSSGAQPLGGGFAYYMAILSTFMNYKPYFVRAFASDWQWEGKIRTLAITNGNYYGHGLCIAPDAKVDDGLFSVFIVEDVSVFDFIRFSGKLKQGRRIAFRKVHYNETKRLELTAAEPFVVEADGELIGRLPATIEMLPNMIRFLC